MKKRNYFFLTVTFFLLFLFLTGKPVFAQGTFKCIVTPHGLCVPLNIDLSGNRGNNCQTGYLPDDCSRWTGNNLCNTDHPCVPQGNQVNCTNISVLGICPPQDPINCAQKYKCCATQEDCIRAKSREFSCDPGTGNGDDGVTTALGCIPTQNMNDFVAWLLSKLIFIASGIAFLLMVVGAIQILTSAGNPDKVKAGKELITSALSGLLFIILSIFLLKLIGVDILHIPGLGK